MKTLPASDPQSSTSADATLDVLSQCECCRHSDVAWAFFLEEFVNYLPERGIAISLRLTFAGHRQGEKAVVATDAYLRRVQAALVRRGEVAQDKHRYVSLGVFVRACGNEH
jgi:hypothetical protein